MDAEALSRPLKGPEQRGARECIWSRSDRCPSGLLVPRAVCALRTAADYQSSRALPNEIRRMNASPRKQKRKIYDIPIGHSEPLGIGSACKIALRTSNKAIYEPNSLQPFQGLLQVLYRPFKGLCPECSSQ